MGSRGNPNPGRGTFPYFPSRSEHVNRNANNACPRTKPRTDSQCPTWNQDTGALGGMNGGKFRSDRGDECAYDANGTCCLMKTRTTRITIAPVPGLPSIFGKMYYHISFMEDLVHMRLAYREHISNFEKL